MDSPSQTVAPQFTTPRKNGNPISPEEETPQGKPVKKKKIYF